MREYFLAFNCFQKFGPVRLGKLLEVCGDIERAYHGKANDFLRAGISEKLSNEFFEFRKKFVLAKVLEDLEREKINYVTWEDADYPKLLKEIYDPPPLLYYRGIISDNNNFSLAVVGARNYTAYGEKIINDLIPVLVAYGFNIVSGLAYGIDALAHQQTVINNGRAIAVLGSGLDWKSVYPYENRKLAESIIANQGAVISEFPLLTPPLSFNFPQRNRIVAGLSKGVIVIEAKDRSGTLITANFALEQGREVMAVPGSIFSETSNGTNDLIKKGARVITKIDDVLEAFNLESGDHGSLKSAVKEGLNLKREYVFSDAVEEKIFQILQNNSLMVDEIIKISKLDTKVINSTLSIMELKGMIKNKTSGEYIIC